MIATIFEPTPKGPHDAPKALQIARHAAEILAPDCSIELSKDRAAFVVWSSSTKRSKKVPIAVRADFTIHQSTMLELMETVRWFGGFPVSG